MIWQDIKHYRMKYCFRLIGLLLILCGIACLYRMIGIERFQTIAQILSERLPALLDVISFSDVLCVSQNFIELFFVPVHIWFMYTLMRDAVSIVSGDMQTGRIYYICNQLMDVKKYFLKKSITIAIHCLVNIAIYNIVMLISVWIITGELPHLELMMYSVRVDGVALMFMYIAMLYATLKGTANEMTGLTAVLVGTIVIGNIHRVLSVIICIIRNIGKSGSELFPIRRFLAGGYFLSPISWLDPFHMYEVGDWVWILLVCLFVSAGCYCASRYLFLRKER